MSVMLDVCDRKKNIFKIRIGDFVKRMGGFRMRIVDFVKRRGPSRPLQDLIELYCVTNSGMVCKKTRRICTSISL
jgi:hypothetical protein